MNGHFFRREKAVESQPKAVKKHDRCLTPIRDIVHPRKHIPGRSDLGFLPWGGRRGPGADLEGVGVPVPRPPGMDDSAGRVFVARLARVRQQRARVDA